MPKPQHIHEVYIRTTPERLWQALTDPELTKGYYYGCAVGSTWEPGAAYAYVGEMGPAITGQILEADPPRRLVMTFTMAYDPETAAENPSRVTWEISPVGDHLCRLTVVHSDFGGLSKTWATTLTGWTPILSGLKTLLETGTPLGLVPDDGPGAEAVDLDAEWHRDLGIETHQEVWGLLGMTDRTAEQDETMVRAAYASAYHWSRAAGRTLANEARSEWMLSHVQAVLGRAEPAQHHAERCLAVVDAAGLQDFDRAYAHEALARAAAAAGQLDVARRERAAAAAVPIADEEDRKIFVDDLAAEPWYGAPAD
jgi:uncharacterized protein YndB with AHSA1/START domain